MNTGSGKTLAPAVFLLVFVACLGAENGGEHKVKPDFARQNLRKTIKINIPRAAKSLAAAKPPSRKRSALARLISPSRESNTIIVPPFTELILTVNSYCLKSSGAGPAKKEPFAVVRVDEDNEIRRFLDGMWGQCRSRGEVQSIAWNMTNGLPSRHWPREQRELLLLSGMARTIEKTVPFGIGRKIIHGPKRLAKGIFVFTRRNFKATERLILGRKSSYRIESQPEPSHLHPFLITPQWAGGFKDVRLSVYNYTSRAAAFRASEYRLEPARSDVQPLALELSRYLSCRHKQVLPR